MSHPHGVIQWRILMNIVDANIILRYLLDDHEELSDKATEIIENNETVATLEIVCEVVYVLQKVYEVTRLEISNEITALFNEHKIAIDDLQLLVVALVLFAEETVDFVDAILIARHRINKDVIFSFDKTLNKLLKR